MVQLNTTYNSSIHQKIFVLKGDEGYARTTDTIATLITNFGNYATYISKCHVGLEIQVLRELGDSFLHIYCDDEELYSIPWSDSRMAQIIDEDWNDKGVYWENGKLIIGKYDYENNINTGLFLLYDVEHTIKVRYDGNKNCLGSSTKPIVFTVPTPDTFATELSFNKATPPRYAPNTTINDITVTLTSDNELTSSKLINIYDDSTTPSTLLTQVELEQDVASTITLTGLSDGVHKIRASWTGDGECYATDNELDVSVGYKITNLEYPSYLISGTSGTLSCIVTDYFDNPWNSLGGFVGEEGSVVPISESSSTDSHGFISFDTVYFSNYPFFVQISGWSGEKHTIPIIQPNSVEMNWQYPIVEITDGTALNRLEGYVCDENGNRILVDGIPITIEVHTPYEDKSYERETANGGKFGGNYSVESPCVVTTTATVTGTQISNTAKWIAPKCWWTTSENKQVGTCTNQSNVIKTSNGFKFDSGANVEKEFVFSFGSIPTTGIYTIEFDRITSFAYGAGSWDWSCCGFSMLYRNYAGNHYKFVYDVDNHTATIFVDGIEKATRNYNRKSFAMVLNNMYAVIDNLVIVREE